MKSLVAAGLIGMMAGGAPAASSPQAASAPQTRDAPQQATAQQDQNGAYRINVNVNTVLTNVVARDRKTGELVRGLKASDFTISEDKKTQRTTSFDFQDVNDAAVLAEKNTTTGKASIADMVERNFGASADQLRDHRLIVLFFDLSSMQDEDIDRAVDAATNYINKQMQPADLVAMVSMNTGLSLDLDFSSNKGALLKVLKKYDGDDSSGLANGGTTGSTDATSDDASSFSADDSEFNSLNTDRELFAIRAIAKSLEHVDQKKSMLYFSGGLTKQGIENEASLRSATNEATRANMAIYAVDTRGLEALPPVGDASKGSIRGVAAYSGATTQGQFSANYSSQETLSTLSTETGGKLFTDSNDFAPAFQQIQRDTEAYYILGFHSSNQAHDGSFRHLTVTCNRKDVKLEYRPGYFAPADFQHQKTEDRELALAEQMRSDVPATDVALYLQALYFRDAVDGQRGPGAHSDLYYIPVSLVVPGSQIPFAKVKDLDKASLDILGNVKDAQGITVGTVRDTVKLAVDQSQQVPRKNIQYSTGFALAPGKYQLKFVVRENQTGAMGSFETAIQVPDLRKLPMKLSSVVLASQRIPNTQKDNRSPLVRDGLEWVPNVAHVFRQDGHLYLLYEVYDPARPHTGTQPEPTPAASPGLTRRPGGGPADVMTSIEFLRDGTKVYETKPVSAIAVNDPSRNAVSFQFEVPLAALKPGTYICQVNVIDNAGGSFSFPRTAVRIAAPNAAAAAAAGIAAAPPCPDL